MIMRPSASVFPTRTEAPLRLRMSSSATYASSPTELRTMASAATTFTAGRSISHAWNEATYR